MLKREVSLTRQGQEINKCNTWSSTIGSGLYKSFVHSDQVTADACSKP